MTAIGLMLEGQAGLTWQRWGRLLEAAEVLGFQCVFRSDHFTNSAPPDQESLEAWVSLTYAATQTEAIEFGTLVSPVTFRHPSMLVRMAAAIDDLSDGRLVLGMGAGWQEREHHNFGVHFPDRATRFEMLKDELEIVARLLISDTPVTYTGQAFFARQRDFAAASTARRRSPDPDRRQRADAHPAAGSGVCRRMERRFYQPGDLPRAQQLARRTARST